MMTAAEARRRARGLREQAIKETSGKLRDELKAIAEQYDILAVEIDRLGKSR